MIKKGIISNIQGRYADIIIPEYDNAVTPMLPFAKSINEANVRVGDRCVVAFYDTENINLANGSIIIILSNESDYKALDEKISELQKKIDENAGGSGGLSDEILAQIQEQISKNATDIQANTTNIQKNTADIEKNTTNIDKNTTEIAKNTADIEKNTTDIEKNSADIEQNSVDIQVNANQILTNTNRIQNNVTNIQKNATDIQANATNIKLLYSLVDSWKNYVVAEGVENNSPIRETADGTANNITVVDGLFSKVRKIQGKTFAGGANGNLLDVNGAIDPYPLYAYHPQNTGENRAPCISIVGNDIVCAEIWSGASACIIYDRTYSAGTYTLKVDVETNATDTNWRMLVTSEISGWTKLNAKIYWGNEVWINNTASGASITFTATAPFKLGFAFAGTTNAQKTYKNIMLNEGSTALPYTPYFDGLKNAQISGIKSVSNLLKTYGRTQGSYSELGGDTPTSKRTFDETKFWAGMSGNGYFRSAVTPEFTLEKNYISVVLKQAGYGLIFPVKCKPNTTYSVNYNISPNSGNYVAELAVEAYTKDGVYIGKLHYSPQAAAKGYSFTTQSNCYWMIVAIAGNAADTKFEYSNIMLTYSEPKQPYREYEESLLTLPENTELGEWDNLTDKTLTKGTSEILTLDGTENWYSVSQDKDYANIISGKYLPNFTAVMGQLAKVNNPYIPRTLWFTNNGYEGVSINNFAGLARPQIGVFLDKATIGLDVNKTDYTTDELVTAFKAYLSANPLVIACELQEPTTTELDFNNFYRVWNKGQETMLLGNTMAIPTITNDYYIVVEG